MQTDLRYFFPVYLVFLPIDQNDELIVCRLFDQFSRHILDAVPSFEKMNINRSAGIADKVFILPQDEMCIRDRFWALPTALPNSSLVYVSMTAIPFLSARRRYRCV